MSASAEKLSHLVHIDPWAFRTQANACEVRLDFFEHARNDNGLDCADMIDQAFTIGGIRAGACIIGLLEPEISDSIFGGKTKLVINMSQQPYAGEGIGLIDLVANLCEICPSLHQLARHMV